MKKTMKVLSFALALIMILGLAACKGGTSPGTSPATSPETSAAKSPAANASLKVGISMPTKSLQRWNQDGANLQQAFQAAGYTVDLEYAGDNDVPTQVSQIENMISSGYNVLIIAAIDGSALTEALAPCKAQGITVIAYDRLIMNSDAVSYYATFDNTLVGKLQAQSLVDKLDIANKPGPFNFELFTGSPDDNNIHFFFNGAMSVLQPFIDSGKIVVKSGQTQESQVTTKDWSSANAQSRMENLISQYSYGPKGTKLDAVMSNNDSIAQGVAVALQNAGYTADNFPLICGQDCDKASVINMRNGFQYSSVFKDTRTLADAVKTMVGQIAAGQTVQVNDTSTYNNGVAVIPSYLCQPVAYTIADIGKLVDSGYYTWADIGGDKGTLPLDGQIK
ncbi:MAG: sugar-binding protein [Firmicutes bacterium]|nr:sugar-binding protein [Bacillota bacterium]